MITGGQREAGKLKKEKEKRRNEKERRKECERKRERESEGSPLWPEGESPGEGKRWR